MTISSSLNAGVMGLNVNASRLATISDNIANSATNGYKRSDVDFASLVVNQRPSIYSAGGVRAITYKEVTSAGPLTGTGNSTDIAINGGGMIPVTDLTGTQQSGEERSFMMVPTGSFSADENGFLRTSSGLYLLGWPTSSTGELDGGVNRGNTASLVPVNTNVGQFSASATEKFSLGVNLPANVTTAEPFTLPIEYFDSLGLSQNIQVTFTKDIAAGAPPNSWAVEIRDEAGDPNAVIGSFTVQFNDENTDGGTILNLTPGAGTTYDPLTGEIGFDIEGGPVTAFVGKAGEAAGLTQLGTTFSPYNVTKDGSPIGDLETVEINSQGQLEAVYNTGFRRVLFQVPVADVTNPNGLEAVSNQAYRVSSDSGDVYLWDSGEGPTGDYVGYALMESNTDVAAELTSLIETQRAYSSNAKIIQTVDEMLQETTNLKR